LSTSDYPAQGWVRARVPSVRTVLVARPVSAAGWIVVALVLVGAAIRVLLLDNQSFWADEALTAYEARIPFGSMLSVVLHVETTPPLYFVLIWIWGHALGTGEVALRSLSALAGVATVPIAYLAGRELASRRAGVLAAAFMALNPFLIWYSQEARAYMLLVALSGASFLWFARARRDPGARNLGWWAAWSALALMTHFFAGFLIAAEAAWLLSLHRNRVVAVAVGAVAAVEAAMLPFALLDTSHGAGWIAKVPKYNRVSQAISEWGLSNLYRRTSLIVGIVGGVGVALLVVFLSAYSREQRTRDAVKVGALVGASVWLVSLGLGYLGYDYFLARNVMPAVIPLAVALAAACVAPRARVVGGVLAVALLAMFSWAAIRVQTHPYLQRPDWRAVARALGPATGPRAILAADGTTADALKIYLPGVDWTEPRGRRIWIREIDVVGATKRLSLVASVPTASHTDTDAEELNPIGRPIPALRTPGGTRVLARMRVHNWVLARFVLLRPMRISILGLVAIAPRFFHRTPTKLLVFFQPAAPIHLTAERRERG
jgi:mannosyltransferase